MVGYWEYVNAAGTLTIEKVLTGKWKSWAGLRNGETLVTRPTAEDVLDALRANRLDDPQSGLDTSLAGLPATLAEWRWVR